ncbi:MAG: DUF4261 domain-containing protein [Thermogutta sp.]
MTSDTPFAIVLLKDLDSLSVPEMAEFFRLNWSDVGTISAEDSQPVTTPQGSLLIPFTIDEMPAFVVIEKEPISAKDLELAILSAWYWPDAAEAVDQSRGFAMVALAAPPADPLARTTLLTQLTAALAKTCDSVAVYWPSANLIHDPEAFFNSAKTISEDFYPLELWVGFHAEPEHDDTVTFFTRGMMYFGLPEIEVYHSTRDLQFLYEHVFNIAHFLLEHGPVIQDGETVGTTDEERFLVTIAPSRFDSRIKTMQIDM